jgi:AraC-like DNA-binding protein
VLRAMETRITRLPPELSRTVVDLFERPHRYDCGEDIARDARISVRSLYRAFERSGLGSPKKMLTVAKLARGYTYLVSSSTRLGRVSQRIRYSRPRLFSEAVGEVFGCSPCKLRKHSDSNEVVLQLLEWLYKPGPLRETEQRGTRH